MTVVAKTPDAAEELAAVEDKAIQKYIIPRLGSQAAVCRRQVLTDSLVFTFVELSMSNANSGFKL